MICMKLTWGLQTAMTPSMVMMPRPRIDIPLGKVIFVPGEIALI